SPILIKLNGTFQNDYFSSPMLIFKTLGVHARETTEVDSVQDIMLNHVENIFGSKKLLSMMR
ncbi:hypothetical protein WA026_016773, partial [Henosepilachna vigintioctopunctata]